MEFLFIPNMTLSGTTATTGKKTPGAPGPSEGFAALLALFQAGQAQAGQVPQATLSAQMPALPQEITLPGSAETREAAVTSLLAQLNTLAGNTMTALEEIESGGGTQEAIDATLTHAALQLGEMLRAFDATTGADSLSTLTTNLAALQDNPRMAVPVLQGDRTFLPAPTTPNTAPQTGADATATELAQTMFRLATGLLGLAKPASSAQQPAPLEAGARPVMPAVEPLQRPAASAQPGLPEGPAPQPVAVRPAPPEIQTFTPRSEIVQPVAEGAQPPAEDARAPGPASPLQPRATELLGMATTPRPAADAAQQPQTQLAQTPLPQGGAELRPPAGNEATEARSATTQMQAPAQPDGFARNLASQIRSTSFSEGRTRIELSPRGLGSIEIDLHPDEAGKLRVVLRAENPAVLNALRGDRASLLAVLGDSGVAVEESALDFEAFGQQRQRQEQAAPPTRLPAGSSDEETVTADPVSPSPRHLPATGRLDIIT